MTLNTLEEEIQEAIPKLFSMAKELTWNKISDEYKFILTEIKDTERNFYARLLLTMIIGKKYLTIRQCFTLKWQYRLGRLTKKKSSILIGNTMNG
jgi:hypothetical protein